MTVSTTPGTMSATGGADGARRRPGSSWGTRTVAVLPAALLCAGFAAPAAHAGNSTAGNSTAGNSTAGNSTAGDSATVRETAVTGASPLTAEARAAGQARAGAGASTTAALEAFGTPERMRAAIPVEQAPFVTAALDRARTAPVQKASGGPVGKAAPAAPKGTSPFAGVGPAPGASSGAPAAVAPNLPSNHPTARTNGKVFFTSGGLSYVCSASVTNSEGKDSVWTAGHCVHSGAGGTWHDNWVFAPAYDGWAANPTPYGYWSSRALWSMNGWTQGSDFTSDMGVAVMGTRAGWHIVDYFGGHGITWNGPTSRGVIALGYPSESPYSGKILRYCTGTTSLRAPQDLKLPCDMTRGSSGGPWLANYDGYWGYLNGVNSRINRIVKPTWMYSPYFDNTAAVLYNSTRNL